MNTTVYLLALFGGWCLFWRGLMVGIGVATLLSAVPAMIQSIAQGLRALAGS